MAQTQRKKRAKLNEYFWHTSIIYINKKQTMELTKRRLYNICPYFLYLTTKNISSAFFRDLVPCLFLHLLVIDLSCTFFFILINTCFCPRELNSVGRNNA